MKYRLRYELESDLANWRAAALAFLLLLGFSLLANVGFVYILSGDEPRLTELVMVKDGKDYRELYLGPEDCLNAGNAVAQGVYWRCETQ